MIEVLGVIDPQQYGSFMPSQELDGVERAEVHRSLLGWLLGQIEDSGIAYQQGRILVTTDDGYQVESRFSYAANGFLLES